jgi:hypothetical protein
MEITESESSYTAVFPPSHHDPNKNNDDGNLLMGRGGSKCKTLQQQAALLVA